MAYTYYTEPLFFEERVLGRTSVASVDQVKTVGHRFTQLSEDGWEFMRCIDIPVVGKVFKSEERRTISVAVFRKEQSPT